MTPPCDFVDENVATSCGHMTLAFKTNIFIACFTIAYAHLELYALTDAFQDCYVYHYLILWIYSEFWYYLNFQDNCYLTVKCISVNKKNRQKGGLMFNGNVNSLPYSFWCWACNAHGWRYDWRTPNLLLFYFFWQDYLVLECFWQLPYHLYKYPFIKSWEELPKSFGGNHLIYT